MRRFYDYQIYFFDCDGVILDSNACKIIAMEEALRLQSSVIRGIEESIEYFEMNFGRSRFHHVKVFLDRFLKIKDGVDKDWLESEILKNYANFVEVYYEKSKIIDGFIEVVEKLPGQKFVVSGSEEIQLQRTFVRKGLNKYFDGVYGSPKNKSEIITEILNRPMEYENAIIVGDALADIEAARSNKIDFLGLVGFSNTPDRLSKECDEYGLPYVNCWKDVVDDSLIR